MKVLFRTLLIAAPLALSLSAADNVTPTKHNLSITGPNQVFKTGTLGNQICVYCHTPHNALTAGGPLWNRVASTATYTLYGTTILGHTPTALGATSKSCLSCHDGTVAMFSLTNTYLGTITAADLTNPKLAASNIDVTTGMMTGQAMIGADLSNDHPVGIVYPVDAGYKAASGLVGVKLFSNQVECASCHSVHDNTNSPFLRVNNAGSALCLSCHNK